MTIHYIKDPVHHFIKINDDDKKIMDTSLFQRLRNIFHLGTGYFTYPGATHSRFEHSLGVMSLGNSVLENVINNAGTKGYTFWKDSENDDEIMRTLRYACLLHDVGHAPFSHVCEEFYSNEKDSLISELKSKLEFINDGYKNTEQILSKPQLHELMSCSIILSHYKDILNDLGVKAENVCAVILGQVCKDVLPEKKLHYKVLANILNSSIDVDKFDYLLRDDYMTGASLASIDKGRLLTSYTVTERNTLVLNRKALSLVTNLIVGRNQVYMWVYQHHKVVFTDNLLKKMIQVLINEDLIETNEFFSKSAIIEKLIDDYDIISEIRKNVSDNNSESLSNLYKMWSTHNFLKPCWKHAFEYNEKIKGEARDDLIDDVKYRQNELENWLAKKLDIETGKVMVSFAKFTPFTIGEKDIRIEPLEIGGSTKYAIEDLGLHIQSIEKYSNVPYVYVDKEQIENCLVLLRNYDRNKISN